MIQTFFKKWKVQKIFFLCAVVFGISLLLVRIMAFKNLTHYGDEAANILAVKNISESGIPYVRPLLNTPNWLTGALSRIYWEYSLELYLRFPFYALSKLISYDWARVSSAFFILIPLVLLSFLVIRDRAKKLPLITLGYFVILFSFSILITSQFHYVRYYSFSTISITLGQFIASYFYLFKKDNLLKRNSMILLVTLLPTFFHMINLAFFVFWLIFIIIDLIAKPKAIKNFINSKMLSKILLVLALVVAILLARFILDQYHVLLGLNSFDIGIWRRFYEMNIDPTLLGILSLITLITLGLYFGKYLSNLEKLLASLSISVVFFCLIFFSFVSSFRMMGHYLIFLHPIWLIILAVLLSAISKGIVRMVKNNGLKLLVYPAVIFVFLFTHNINQYYLEPHNVTLNDIGRLTELTKDERGCIFFSDETLFFFGNFPSFSSYLLRTPPDIASLKANPVKGGIVNFDLHLDSRGEVRNANGERYTGSKQAFCRALTENSGKVAVFYRIGPDAAVWSTLLENNLTGDFATMPTDLLFEKACK